MRKFLRVCACVYVGVSLQVCVGGIKEMAPVSVDSWYSERVSALSVCVSMCMCVCLCHIYSDTGLRLKLKLGLG